MMLEMEGSAIIYSRHPQRQNKAILNDQTNKRSTQRSQTETVQTKLKWANAQEHQFANYANNVYIYIIYLCTCRLARHQISPPG